MKRILELFLGLLDLIGQIIGALAGWAWRRKQITLPVAVLLLGILGAVGLVKLRPTVKTKPPRAPAPLVRAIEVRSESVQLKVRAQGNVTARTESNIIAQVPGQIVDVAPAFANGGFFKKGEMLVRVDARDHELALARAKAQIAQAEVRLAREEEEARLAKEEWQIVGNGTPSDLVLRKPQLEEARAAVQAAQSSVDQARLNLNRTQVRAPFDGRILAKNVDVGQFVNPGVPLARIYSVDYAEIRLPIPHDQLAYLDLSFDYRNGAPADPLDVSLSAQFAGKRHRWEGKIVRAEGQIDPGTRMVNLVARVDNPYDKSSNPERPPLLVGLFVDAEIFGRKVENVFALPRSAMRGTDQILLIDSENRLHFTGVEVLRFEQNRVLLSNGLQTGDRVCVSALDVAVEGMRVRVAGNDESTRGTDRRDTAGQDAKGSEG